MTEHHLSHLTMHPHSEMPIADQRLYGYVGLIAQGERQSQVWLPFVRDTSLVKIPKIRLAFFALILWVANCSYTAASVRSVGNVGSTSKRSQAAEYSTQS